SSHAKGLRHPDCAYLRPNCHANPIRWPSPGFASSNPICPARQTDLHTADMVIAEMVSVGISRRQVELGSAAAGFRRSPSGNPEYLPSPTSPARVQVASSPAVFLPIAAWRTFLPSYAPAGSARTSSLPLSTVPSSTHLAVDPRDFTRAVRHGSS